MGCSNALIKGSGDMYIMAMLEPLMSAAVMMSIFLLHLQWQGFEGFEAFGGVVFTKVRAAAAASVCQIGCVDECHSGMGRSLLLAGMVQGVSSDIGSSIGGYGALICSGSKYWGASGVVSMSASMLRSNRSCTACGHVACRYHTSLNCAWCKVLTRPLSRLM
jgi:hypothetical protein